MKNGVGKPRVFVSSTSEFHTLRALLHQQLDRHYEFIDYEQEGAGGRIDERLAALVSDAEVVLGIVGAKYGHTCPIPAPKKCKVWHRPSKPGALCPALIGPGTWSYVQWEFSKACANSLWIIALLKSLPLEELDENQRPFRSFLSGNIGNMWLTDFGTDADAVEKADQSLSKWQEKYWNPNKRGSTLASEAVIWISIATAVTCAILFVLSVSLILAGKLSVTQYWPVLAILFSSMLACLGIAALIGR
jgi:hypothetical protein